MTNAHKQDILIIQILFQAKEIYKIRSKMKTTRLVNRKI